MAFEKPPTRMTRHIRPLYIKAEANGVLINRVLIDEGAWANVLPLRMLKKLHIKKENFSETDVLMT
ncbi:conserved hypothetical protein [Ricinus communis]|uniref:Aspartic peptidase DDI1-type domain-containing protein n=1 Tax=Ricinus communis TaxID=3988 RepID=B9S3S9_RICCO|nr:conserved hypothetical protein [Ricinus communis]